MSATSGRPAARRRIFRCCRDQGRSAPRGRRAVPGPLWHLLEIQEGQRGQSGQRRKVGDFSGFRGQSDQVDRVLDPGQLFHTQRGQLPHARQLAAANGFPLAPPQGGFHRFAKGRVGNFYQPVGVVASWLRVPTCGGSAAGRQHGGKEDELEPEHRWARHRAAQRATRVISIRAWRSVPSLGVRTRTMREPARESRHCATVEPQNSHPALDLFRGL